MAPGRKQFAEAQPRCQRVLEMEPQQSALAMNSVARLMVPQGRRGAKALDEQASALMPNRWRLPDTLAAALAAEGQPKKALEVRARAVALAPQDPALKRQLARLPIRSGQKSRARTELEGLAKPGNRFAEQAAGARLLKTLQPGRCPRPPSGVSPRRRENPSRRISLHPPRRRARP